MLETHHLAQLFPQLQFGSGMNLSIVAIARFNRTIETGRIMALDKAKVKFYGRNQLPC